MNLYVVEQDHLLTKARSAHMCATTQNAGQTWTRWSSKSHSSATSVGSISVPSSSPRTLGQSPPCRSTSNPPSAAPTSSPARAYAVSATTASAMLSSFRRTIRFNLRPGRPPSLLRRRHRRTNLLFTFLRPPPPGRRCRCDVPPAGKRRRTNLPCLRRRPHPNP